MSEVGQVFDDAGGAFHSMSGDGKHDGHIRADLQCWRQQQGMRENSAPLDSRPTDPEKGWNNYISDFGASNHAQEEAKDHAEESKTEAVVTQILFGW